MVRTILTTVSIAACCSASAQMAGDLDLSFSTDGISTAHFAPIGVDHAMGVAIQPNGRIVVVGSTQQDLQTSMALARFMPNGALDTDFGSGGQVFTTIGSMSDGAMALALQADGKIVVAGFSFENGSGDRFVVARYDSTGALDPGFGTNGIQINNMLNGGRLASVAIRDDGYIIAGGMVNEAPSNEMFLVARYTPDGTPDPTFDGDGFATIDITADDDAGRDIVLEPSGGILIAGYCGGGNDMGMALVRLADDGSLDNSLDGDGILITQLSNDQDAASSVVRQPGDGKILVCGSTTFMPMVFLLVARYNTDGSLDNTFAGDGIYQSPHPGLNFPGNMVLAPDGRIVIGGTWATNFLVAIVNPDGTADTNFSSDGVVTTSFGQNSYGNDLALDAGGKAVLVGASDQGAPTFNDFVVLRYHTGLGVGVMELDRDLATPLVFPDPIDQEATLRFALDRPERISVRLVDAAGRTVRRFLDQRPCTAGPLELVLPFTDGPAPGSYVLLITSEHGTAAVHVVKE